MSIPAVPYDHKDLKSSVSSMPPPMAVPTAPPSPMSIDDDIDGHTSNEHVFEQLLEQGFSTGLAQALVASKEAFAMRFWIIDNSGSMLATDGHRLVDSTPSYRRDSKARFVVPSFYMVNCSRWEEIRETVLYHVRLAALMEAPTRFRLLNPRTGVPSVFSIADTPTGGTTICRDVTVDKAQQYLYRIQPGGGTPLTRHIQEIQQEIMAMLPKLEASGQRVAVVIATDGLPTSSRGGSALDAQDEFMRALKNLEGLPVWIVVRLCTDDHNVGDFYHHLDANLELSVDVLDDFCGEAEEVQARNSWLNYGLPLHRIREMGSCERILDLLDERSLSKSEIGDFCRFLFGEGSFDGFPEPSVEWSNFVSKVENLLLPRERMQWNPVKKQALPWINLRQVDGKTSLRQVDGKNRGRGEMTVIFVVVAVAVIAWLMSLDQFSHESLLDFVMKQLV